MYGDRSAEGPGPDQAAGVLLRQRIDLLYGALPQSLAAIVLGAALAVHLISHGQPDWVQQVWLWGLGLVSLARLVGWLHFGLGRGRDAPERRRLGWAVGGVLVSGACWALASPLLFPEDDPGGRAVLAFLLAGISAGAINTLSVFLWVALAHTGLVLIPLVLRLALAEGEPGPGVALMCLLYLALLATAALRYRRTILDGLRMRYARERAEAHLERQALYDPLTDLPNRRLLMERLRQDLAFAHRHGHLGALAFLDLDRFKTINDSLGHQVGDALLRAAATRLAAELAEGDTAARLGGDEFVVLFAELSRDPVEAAHLARQGAEQIRLALSAPYPIGDRELHVGVSIGIALYPTDGDDPDSLLRAADTAMYRSKDAGRNAIRFFLPEMQEAAMERLELEKALRQALANDELRLYFQPQVDGDGRILGVEALARWPSAGVLAASPGQFVPLAEETGLIYALGDWVLERACAAMAEIRAAPGGERISRMAVNVSPRQFRRPELVQRLESLIADYGISPSHLELELTEGTLVADVEDTTAKMTRLRALGVRFAIDDFGTGYSSLAYLKRLPVDALKIDRSFVRDVVCDPSDAVIVAAIVDLARHLGLKAIAEGVDSPQVHERLLELGCDAFQGYLFYRPMPLADLLALLAAEARLARPPIRGALRPAGQAS
jgi:diguanylate cyclase (GGDEF)-like protein